MKIRLFLLLLVCSAPAFAWGPDGHRIVADLAQRQLQPRAQAEVARLLAGESSPTLPAVANWADEIRAADGTNAKLHYVNFRDGGCDYVPARECPDGQCIVAAINRYFLVLSDASRPDAERREALKYLVHFVGDVHQPLHAGAREDRGGNEFQVNLDGRGSNLHSVWDREILATRKLAPPAYARALAAQSPLPPDRTGGSDRPAVEWALESCRLVHSDALYPPRYVIGADYLLAHRPLAEQRLREAGRRLAALVNYALAPRQRSSE